MNNPTRFQIPCLPCLPCRPSGFEKTCAVFCLTLLCFFLISASPQAARAGLQPMAPIELEGVYGQSGIDLVFKNIQLYQHIGYYKYCASDGGFLALEHFEIDPFRLNFDFGSTLTNTGYIKIDTPVVYVSPWEDWDDDTDPSAMESTPIGMIGMVAPLWDQDMEILIGSLIFSNGTDTYDLGQLNIGDIDLNSWQYYIAPRASSSSAAVSGVDWQYSFQSHYDQFSYGYKIDATAPADPTKNERLVFKDIYFGDSFADYAGDDPTDPTSWKPFNNVDYGEFSIGDMFGDQANNIHSNPARFDVGVCDIGGIDMGMFKLSLPIEGSIRFEQAEFGGVDFGPGAIDGIHAHRLDLYFIP